MTWLGGMRGLRKGDAGVAPWWETRQGALQLDSFVSFRLAGTPLDLEPV